MNDRHSIMINNQYTDNYIKKLEQRIQMIEQENKTLKISLKEYAGNDFKRQLDYAKLDLAFYQEANHKLNQQVKNLEEKLGKLNNVDYVKGLEADIQLLQNQKKNLEYSISEMNFSFKNYNSNGNEAIYKLISELDQLKKSNVNTNHKLEATIEENNFLNLELLMLKKENYTRDSKKNNSDTNCDNGNISGDAEIWVDAAIETERVCDKDMIEMTTKKENIAQIYEKDDLISSVIQPNVLSSKNIDIDESVYDIKDKTTSVLKNSSTPEKTLKSATLLKSNKEYSSLVVKNTNSFIQKQFNTTVKNYTDNNSRNPKSVRNPRANQLKLLNITTNCSLTNDKSIDINSTEKNLSKTLTVNPTKSKVLNKTKKLVPSNLNKTSTPTVNTTNNTVKANPSNRERTSLKTRESPYMSLTDRRQKSIAKFEETKERISQKKTIISHAKHIGTERGLKEQIQDKLQKTITDDTRISISKLYDSKEEKSQSKLKKKICILKTEEDEEEESEFIKEEISIIQQKLCTLKKKKVYDDLLLSNTEKKYNLNKEIHTGENCDKNNDNDVNHDPIKQVGFSKNGLDHKKKWAINLNFLKNNNNRDYD